MLPPARLAVLLLLWSPALSAYSVLSHEAVVDSLWNDPIQKMLLRRFPNSTQEELQEAHGYAYGGCIIQDMGYYPFSSKLFSDLTHYVRSGDFVKALLKDSQNLNEYAFAIGALAHYAADTNGHGVAVNVAVPMLYPRMRKRFGAIVTYWDNPLSHIRTEFSFDVLQVARGRYASDDYRHFIGFRVALPVLERALIDTYGLELKDLFGNLDLAIGTFRYTTSSVIPQMTNLAWEIRDKEITKETPGMTRNRFLFNLSRASYEKDWGNTYRRPNFLQRFIAFLIRILPKIGPLRSLQFKVPSPEVEALFMKSFNATVDAYRIELNAESNRNLDLPNENFDTGLLTEAGKYLGADLAYDDLLHKLTHRKFANMTPELRSDILKYYDARKPPTDKKALKSWQEVTEDLDQLRQYAMPAVAAR